MKGEKRKRKDDNPTQWTIATKVDHGDPNNCNKCKVMKIYEAFTKGHKKFGHPVTQKMNVQFLSFKVLEVWRKLTKALYKLSWFWNFNSHIEFEEIRKGNPWRFSKTYFRGFDLRVRIRFFFTRADGRKEINT